MRRISAVLLPAVALAVTLPLAACGSSSSNPSGGGATNTTNTATPAASTGTAAAGTGTVAPEGCPPAAGTTQRTTTFTAAPPMCIDPAKTYTATMTTDAGPVTIELFANKTPKTVNNFVYLARNHYYDGLTFHRVIQGFMAQGGDPQGTGSGGPGYEFEDELPAQGEYKVGSVAMANAGPNTNGSQFFIVTGDAGVGLPPLYSLFGQVTSGMEAVKKIEADGSAGDGPPATKHTIQKVTITEK